MYLVRIFRSGRSDAELKKVIKKTAEFALSEKNPEEFLEKCGSSPTEKEFEEIDISTLNYDKKKITEVAMEIIKRKCEGI